jgi:hypothetical protein
MPRRHFEGWHSIMYVHQKLHALGAALHLGGLIRGSISVTKTCAHESYKRIFHLHTILHM